MLGNAAVTALTSHCIAARGLLYHWSSAQRRGPSTGQEGGREREEGKEGENKEGRNFRWREMGRMFSRASNVNATN